MTCNIWIIDTSALINCKKAVPASKQWELFEHLKRLVEEGRLCFPRQVTDELKIARHVDTPEAWALNVSGRVVHAYEPDQLFVAAVMEVAGDVIEVDAEDDPGDPYVLAQAMQVRDLGHFPTVVTEDVVDRGYKIAMTTACRRIVPPLPYVQLEDLLVAIGFAPQ